MDKTRGGGMFPSFMRHGIHWKVVGIDHEDWIVQENHSFHIVGLTNQQKSIGQLILQLG